MPETTARWSGFADYAPDGRAFDEMVSARGVVRPHGAGLVGALDALGPIELSARLEAARRTDPRPRRHLQRLRRPARHGPALAARPGAARRRAGGVGAAGGGPGAAGAAARPDPRRPLRTASAWSASGLLPPALVYANPGFLRPCHGLPVARGRHLHLYAADLARTPDGAWWVLADRTQAPSGAGYALENRIVLSRSLPEPFRDCRVQRLAPFFRGLREMLHALAPRPTDAPRVVLLTSGPFNETYFEHAYLARYLGFTLVEGGDLTVRDEGVYLKTLDGLAAGRRRAPPHGRRLLRSAGAARRFLARRRRPGAGGPRRARRRRQRPRQRRPRDAGDAAVPARPVPAAARRGPAAAVGADLVVRPAARARSRHRPSRRDGRQAGVLAHPPRAGLRRAPVAARARGADRRNPGAARRVRRPVGAGAVDGAGVGRGAGSSHGRSSSAPSPRPWPTTTAAGRSCRAG